MSDRIDPPSSMHALELADLVRHCETGEIWAVGEPVHACMMLTPKRDALYLGKLAVAEREQGRGLARKLVDLAESRAKLLGKSALELQVRIELVENHRVFEELGFVEVSKGAHPGFERATYLCMEKPVQSS